MAKNEVKWGAILSYLLIFCNAAYGLFLTPYILGQIGESSYGVYKTISAFTSSLMVLDLGLGGTMMRYIAKYRADKKEDKIPNFVSMGLIQTGIICAVVGAAVAVLYLFLDNIYASGLTAAELAKAKELYIFLGIGIIAHIFENFLNGIITGHNKFTFANGIKAIRLAVRIVAVIVLLGFFKDSLTLVLIDLVVTCLFVAAEWFFIWFKLKVKPKYTHWDKTVFAESFVYTILMFLTSIVAQVNTNFSNVAIGAILNSSAVTVYSMAILIFGMYEQMSTAISGVMLPTVTNSLSGDDDRYTKTLSLVVKAGRVQFAMLGATLAGFIALGKPFVFLWLGNGYEDVYNLVLILLGPALLELCINVCLSILRAKNMLGFRTFVITVSTAMNLTITLLLTKHIGYYASAIGTGLSFLLGSVIVMGIYYKKKLGISIVRLYQKIFKGIWVCVVISGLVAWGATVPIDGAFAKFVVGIVSFVVTYIASLLLLGLNKDEKNSIFNALNKKKEN